MKSNSCVLNNNKKKEEKKGNERDLVEVIDYTRTVQTHLESNGSDTTIKHKKE